MLFADESTFGSAASSPEFAAAIAELENFADSTQMPTSFVDRYDIVA
jgi:hypothetical protein